jgi:hypothetical protein
VNVVVVVFIFVLFAAFGVYALNDLEQLARDQISGGRSSSGRGDCVVATTASAMPAAADDSLVAR